MVRRWARVLIKLLKGDITQLKADAIVNAANPALLGGGGVDGAIHRAAGPTLLEYCRNLPAEQGVRCPFGEARITPAGQLNAKFVIHAVGPIFDQDPTPTLTLENAYKSSLMLAIEHHCQRIAFPAISCGVYGFPAKAAAEIAIATCQHIQFQQLDVTFCLFDDVMYTTWQNVLQHNKP